MFFEDFDLRRTLGPGKSETQQDKRGKEAQEEYLKNANDFTINAWIVIEILSFLKRRLN